MRALINKMYQMLYHYNAPSKSNQRKIVGNINTTEFVDSYIRPVDTTKELTCECKKIVPFKE